MTKLLDDVMRLAGQLPERDQRYIAAEVMRIITESDGPSWAERVREATPEPPKDLETFLKEAIQTLCRASRTRDRNPNGRRR